MNFKRIKLKDLVKLVDSKNKLLETTNLLGISIDKNYISSVANTIGTDLSKYKLLKKGFFSCNPMHVGRDKRLPVCLYTKDEPSIVSPAYYLFKVVDEAIVLPEYLMLCFRRDSFDRACYFKTDSSVRGGINWDDICDVQIPICSLDEQKEILHRIKAINDKIEVDSNEINELEKLYKNYYLMKFKKENLSSKKLTLGEICYEVERGNIPSYSDNQSNLLDLNQKVNKGLFLDKQFLAFLDPSKKVSKNKFLQIGDVLLNSLGDGTLGRLHLYNECTDNVVVNQHITLIRANKELVTPEFLYSQMTSENYQKSIVNSAEGSTGMLMLNVSKIRNYEIEVPDIQLQQDYTKIVKPIFNKITQLNNEILLLSQLKNEIVGTIG